jgi:hypothetical protein
MSAEILSVDRIDLAHQLNSRGCIDFKHNLRSLETLLREADKPLIEGTYFLEYTAEL